MFFEISHPTKITFSYLVCMFVLVNRWFFSKKFNGIALWPFILVKSRDYKRDTVFINHEKIHLRQQLEMLIIPFYIWYGLEFLIRLLKYKDRYQAYRNISFEREAYQNEKDLDYLKRRSFWRFFLYLFKVTRNQTNYLLFSFSIALLSFFGSGVDKICLLLV